MPNVIHFICEGNTFRSRFAEAYANSINKNSELSFQSSGISADEDEDGPLSVWGKYIIDINGLAQHNKSHWTQTNQKLIDSSNILVFMNDDVFEAARHKYDLTDKQYVIWHILDLEPYLYSKGKSLDSEDNNREGSMEISIQIQEHVDGLLERIAKF